MGGGIGCLKDNALDISLSSKTLIMQGASLCLSKTAKMTPMCKHASASFVDEHDYAYDYYHNYYYDFDYDYEHDYNYDYYNYCYYYNYNYYY